MSDRYAFIEAERASFPIVRGCKLLKVSTSGYYGWSGRPLSPAVPRRARLAVDVSAAHGVSDGIFGYRRVHSELVEAGTVVSAHLVRRLMPEQDLVGAQPRAYRVTTIQDPDAVPAPDLLERNFTSSEPGSRLVGDITYVRTWAGWAYLAVVIDLASKMVVGWSVSNRATATLVIDALQMALAHRRPGPGLIWHSDQGSQYTSGAFGRVCGRLKVRQSMGRTGVCWDNAQAETFFASLKVECVYRTALPTLGHARRCLARYIEVFYNRQRRHSALNYQTHSSDTHS